MAQGTVRSMNLRNMIKQNIRNYSMVMMLAVIMIAFAFLTDGVNLNSRNFTNIIIQNSYILLLAVGMILVIIVGNIDLSVGSVVAFIGAISAMLYNSGIGLFWTVLLSIIVGLLIGVFQGAWIAYAKIPAFIVTLAGMMLFRGLTYIITNVSPIAIKDDEFKQLASGMVNIDALTVNNVYYTAIVVGAVVYLLYILSEIIGRRSKIKYGFEVPPIGVFLFKIIIIGLLIMGLSQRFSTYRGIPTVVLVLGVTILLFSFITNNTVIGRYIYAVGGNARSAKLSGINSELVVFVVHVIMGGICGLAAVIFTGYMNSALPQAGVNFELDAISACFIGGASTSGGIGTVIGAIVGGLVMAAINNGMSLMNIQAPWQYVVKALVLLLAVYYDIYTRRKTGLG
ncbi:multiple monosaccharide ABC transporter permease [Treponema sp. J25]|uniref:multiple monosaccharide ABC transporter permease n=1 Tax=Treponema sp. J25 TaxID=2094121 RepID=UPI001047C9DD|nr:multiple monosaccharide ABC transporter permease [Treponema sp. J25]MCX7656485.1 sugar ABC transporter permease [Treponemataceae bacterium]TCW61763.1 ABC transporter permease [Treponema sp. J25]